jgi:hypothetical protein
VFAGGAQVWEREKQRKPNRLTFNFEFEGQKGERIDAVCRLHSGTITIGSELKVPSQLKANKSHQVELRTF